MQDIQNRRVPELLAPAGSIDAVRAAIANGADAIYLGAGRFNARDEGAQLSLDDLGTACRLAHERGRRIYLTLNTLVKPGELFEAMELLADAIDRGIDAAIVQDMGLVRLIHAVFPAFEIHGSTQMTVHDASGAAVLHSLGVDRVVLARENSLEDIAAIRDAAPGIGLESFVHGALCISYSGQCYMSGMISERSANRGSCAQSCRKDYTLTDVATNTVLDTGYLISARDLAAAEHLDAIADAGVTCLKIEGRKKKPEYVATVTRSYRGFLERMREGEHVNVSDAEMRPLVQIFSRGFTGGMYGGRAGRTYVTRTHPDNRGAALGRVVDHVPEGILVEVRDVIREGDGLGFEPPEGGVTEHGFAVSRIQTVATSESGWRQLIHTRERIPVGWLVVRSSDAQLLASARESFTGVPAAARARRVRIDAELSGNAGGYLTLIARVGERSVTVQGSVRLERAAKHAATTSVLREQLGRLGDTPFVLGALDSAGLEAGLFVPVSELNRLRQRAVDELTLHAEAQSGWRRAALHAQIAAAVADVRVATDSSLQPRESPGLVAEVFTLDDAQRAMESGATEVILDPFLRHPAPSLSRVQQLAHSAREAGLCFRLRTPTIVRPGDRKRLDKWLALELPIMTGHLGLLTELASAGRDVAADYAVNCFNQHTASFIMEQGASRIAASIELTADEISQLVEPWGGRGFEIVVYGRPEGMTIEHCVLSAAFDREPTTCRDLCVQKHTNVELTDPTGYSFPVATDSDCRNRLLHSRPIEGSEFIPRLWSAGVREFRMIFNVAGLPVAELVAAYAQLLAGLSTGVPRGRLAVREIVGSGFTRGHFERAV